MVAVIRKAGEHDIERSKAFALRSGVTFEGIGGPLDRFYVMENEQGNLMAVVAIEKLDESGLLRTLVIDSELCEMGDVVRFFAAVVYEAERQGFKALLLVTPSPDIFESLGFVRASEKELLDPLKAAVNADDKAIAMVREI